MPYRVTLQKTGYQGRARVKANLVEEGMWIHWRIPVPAGKKTKIILINYVFSRGPYGNNAEKQPNKPNPATSVTKARKNSKNSSPNQAKCKISQLENN